MKKTMGLLAVLATLFSLTGCGIMYNKNVASSPMNVHTLAYLEPNVEVGEQVSGGVQVTRILFLTLGMPYRYADGVVYGGAPQATDDRGLFAKILGGAASPVEQAKAAAALKAIEKGNADVLVAPRYTIDQKNFWIFSQMNVKVEGYTGKVKGFHQVPVADAVAAQARR